MKKIMFVCSGNTCRSVMAEYILKHIIKKQRQKGIRVCSRGLNVTEQTINEKARVALQKLGVKIGKFTPKQINFKTAFNEDAVVCMTENQKNAFAEKDNLWSISEVCGCGDVCDPYGKEQSFYDETAKILFSACDIIFEKLKNLENAN